MITTGAVFQGADYKDVCLVQVELTPNGKTGVGHNLSYKTEVLHSRHEQVHVIGVHNQFGWGQATARNASQMLPHTHT